MALIATLGSCLYVYSYFSLRFFLSSGDDSTSTH